MESKKINQLATELAPVLSDLTIIGDPTTGISRKITLSQMASLFTGTVEEYPNLASFPLVGTADTIYIALDTNVLYRWNTSTNAYVELSPNIINSLVFSDANGFDGNISLVGSVATLTITTALTTGSVPFIGASGALSQDNANLFFDDTNNRLGINTNAPTTALDVFGSGIIGRLNGTSTNNAFLGFASAGSNKWSIGNVQSDHRFRIYSEANTAELVSVLSTGEFGIGIANPTTKIHIDGGASALIANLDANVSVAKSISFRSDNSNRINLEVSGTESGSNAGADFFIRRYSDAGALIDTPLTILRSSGNVGVGITNPPAKLSVVGNLRIDIASAGTSAVFTGTGSNFQIQHDGTSAITLINSAGGGYIYKAGDLTTTIFSLSNDGAGTFLNSLQSSSLKVAGSGYFPAKIITLTGAEPTRYSGNIGLNLVGGSILGMSFGTRNNNIDYDNTLNLYNGFVGIGTTAPADKLHLVGGGGNTQSILLEGTVSGANAYIIHKNAAKSYTAGLTVDVGTNNYIIYDNTAAATRFFISNAGNIGLGTTSPKSLLSVAGNISGFVDGTFAHQHYRAASDTFTATTINSVISGATGFLTFGVNQNWTNGNAVERMRLASGGQLCINQSSTTSDNYYINLTGLGGIWAKASNSGDACYVSNGGTGFHFYGMTASNVNTFHVLNNGDVRNTNNSYGAISDIKLKENIEDASPKLQDLLKVKIRNYNLISDESKTKQLGVIAQELEEIFPNMISEYKEIGSEEMIKSVKYSVFVPMLIKAIQEQQQQIEELKALINK